MLSIKSIIHSITGNTGVVVGAAEQASIVAGHAVAGAATKTYNGVTRVEYSKEFSELTKTFKEGRQTGKTIVNNAVITEPLEVTPVKQIEMVRL